MSYQFKGLLHEIFDEQQVSEKFRKREFVVETQDSQYPEQIKFQLTQDKCSLLDNFHVGDEVNVTFALRGRGFNKNGQMLYFTNLEAWRVEGTGIMPGGPVQVQEQRQRPAPMAPAPRPAALVGDDNDLPF